MHRSCGMNMVKQAQGHIKMPSVATSRSFCLLQWCSLLGSSVFVPAGDCTKQKARMQQGVRTRTYTLGSSLAVLYRIAAAAAAAAAMLPFSCLQTRLSIVSGMGGPPHMMPLLVTTLQQSGSPSPREFGLPGQLVPSSSHAAQIMAKSHFLGVLGT